MMMWTGRHTGSLTSIATIASAFVALLAVPATSLAAEVSVSETSQPPNRAELVFEAEHEEENEVTLAKGSDGEGPPDFLEIEVADDGAPLDLGDGCKYGEAPDNPVVCTLHRPRFAYYPVCRGSCPVSAAQRAFEDSWETYITVRLENGDDSFDARSFEVAEIDQIHLNLIGGSGDDEIVSGEGDDTIDPGTGSDDVRSGRGNDLVEAGPDIDDSDRFDLGDDPFDTLSYARRSEPLVLDGTTAGGPGETDELIGVDHVIGGSGSDTFVQTAAVRALSGEHGNDTMVGGDGDDRLFGGPGDDLLQGNGGHDLLVGGEGDDRFDGGDGPDHLLERVLQHSNELPTTFAPHFGSTDGADIADGGDGDDLVELGPGPDVAEGGAGNDRIHGHMGKDALAGGPGDDMVTGEAGPDRMWGGPGSDLLRAGLMREYSLEIFPAKEVDGWRDLVRCGPEFDWAEVNRWDDVGQCEHASVVPLVKFLKTFRNRRAGTAQLSIGVGSSGRLVMFGRDVRKVRRRLTARVEDHEVRATLPVRLKGRAAKALRHRGRATIHLAIRYRADGGVVRTERRRLRLVRRG